MVQDNRLRHTLREGVQFDERPGRLIITVPATNEFLPLAIVNEYEKSNPPSLLIQDGRITLLDIQVLNVGTVQVEGIWIEGDNALISKADFLSIRQGEKGFMHITGYGKVRGDRDLSNLPVNEFDGSLSISVMSALLKNNSF